jgi:hypothetical protein
MGVLLVGPHRPAHDDRGREVAPVGQRFPLVELNARQPEAAGAQLVLERRGWLAGDVLEDEQRGTHIADAGAFPAGRPVSTSPVPTSAPSPVSART